MPLFDSRVVRRWRRFLRRPAGSPFRSRGLAEFEALFGPGCLDRLVTERAGAAPGRAVRVVEFGCGEGRLLLEVVARHPQVEAHGLNREPWRAMRGDRSFRASARRHGVALPEGRWPRAWFVDADRSPLPFADDSVDLVVSQRAIHYVADKARLLEEIWRVLRPDGCALLHLDTRHPRAPDFLQLETPRFVLLDGEGPATRGLGDLVGERGLEGALELRTTPPDRKGRRHVLLEMRKRGRAPLALGLALDRDSTINLLRLRHPRRPEDRSIFWGRRSAFRFRGAR